MINGDYEKRPFLPNNVKKFIGENTDNHMESGDLCVALQVKDNIYAIPIKDTLGIVAGGNNTKCTVLPNALKHVKCIVDLDGLLIPIVNLPGVYDDLPIIGNYIVVLEHSGQNIGILADETHLVRILENSILRDKIAGQKSFVHNGKTYLMLDIPNYTRNWAFRNAEIYIVRERKEKVRINK